MKPWGLLLLPAAAFAQPPSPYVCTHLIDNPYTGQPASCEAVAGNAAFPSFEYVFPQTATASDPPAISAAPALSAPEIASGGSPAALTLLLGALAVGLSRRGSKRLRQ